MTDLKIPNLNKNSEKYLFKKRLTLRRKSKIKLLKESFLMLLLSNLILVINYLIPNKKLILDDFYNNIIGFTSGILNSFSFLSQILLGLFIFFSLLLAIILIVGAFIRISKIFKRKTKQIKFK